MRTPDRVMLFLTILAGGGGSSSSSAKIRPFATAAYTTFFSSRRRIPSSSSFTRTTRFLPPTVLKATATTTTSTPAATSSSSSILGTPSTPFDDGKSPYEITTPIYYVNDKPHIGHAYTSTACDVIARFMRLSGREVFFLSGTDEHGQKVEQSAAKMGVSPQDFVDDVSTNFRDLLKVMNISADYFIRTTDDSHKKAVQHLWNTLVDNGSIYLDNYEGWYSVRDECYYTESELIDGKAPTGADVEWVVKEPSYFFRLSEYENKLLDYYEENEEFIAPESRKNEVISFVKGGLRDLSISRTSFSWGVPVPNDPDHVMYVWVDALANYMSALGYPTTNTDSSDENPGKSTNFDKFWPASLHVVGKDILRFHAVYWPALLMAANLPLPKRLFAHGWWTKDGEKISKSLGNVIDPIDLCSKYGVDQTRFFLMSEVTFGKDGDFSDELMVRKVNANLSNELGNLCQRVVTLIYKNCNKAIPTNVGPYTTEDVELLDKAKMLRIKAAKAISQQAINKYAQGMVEMVWDANKYIDNMEPWTLRKTDIERMKTVLYVLMEVLRYVSILYQPLIPQSANLILDQIGVPQNQRTFDCLTEEYKIVEGIPIEKAKAVFPRLELPGEKETEEEASETKQPKKEKSKKNKKQQSQAPAPIDISKLDIRVGLITNAYPHPDADNLYCETIDIGDEDGQPRQIVSGLRQHYDTAEELIGKYVLVLANLKKRKLVGVESYGMVLCASSADGSQVVELVEPPMGCKVGERVLVEGYDGEPATENQIQKKKMLDKIFPLLKTNEDGIATYKGIPFRIPSVEDGVCKAPSGLPNADVA